MPQSKNPPEGWTVVGAPHADGDDDGSRTHGTTKYVVRRTIREFFADGCVDAAAGLTFYAILAIFPATIAVFSLLGVVGQDGAAVNAVIGIVEDVGSEEAAAAIRGPLEQLGSAPGAGIALIGGILVAVWSASRYVGAFRRAMNGVYDVEEGRSVWKLRPLQLLVTLVAVVAGALIGSALVLSGDVLRAVGAAIGLGDGVLLAWNILKWPLLLVLLVLLIALLYSTPNVKQPKLRLLSIGALFTLGVIAITTAGFAVYIAHFSGLEQTYGSLAGIILLLLWLWSTNIAALFGAELNAELERRRELQAGIAAEETVQLPLRDGRKIVARAEHEREDVEEARRIREEHSGH